VIVLAANYTDAKAAKGILRAWFAAKHAGDRHARRVSQIKEIESRLKGR
jgi:ribose 5-phosphate isomerase RpiB